jgi:hypothetical protein
MSTLAAALIVAGVLAIGVPALWWQIRAAAREESRKARFIREHCWPSAGRVACAPDNEAGINLADADECALTYSLPAYDPATDPQWAAGRARLLDAVRDHRTNTTEGEA